MQHQELTQAIIGCAMKVHRVLGPGFLESVYQRALQVELLRSGFMVECGKSLQVTYEGVIVGDFCADMVANELVLIENKAVRALTVAHEVQLVNYLTATGIEVGLLLNFGAERLEFKRKHRTYRNPDADTLNTEERARQTG